MTEDGWEYAGDYLCPFCGHIWEDVGISKCKPHAYAASCPECLAFGFPLKLETEEEE